MKNRKKKRVKLFVNQVGQLCPKIEAIKLN